MDKPTTQPNDQELAQLKETILKSVFGSEPLPGSTILVTFPDLPFILAQSDLYVLDETLNRPIYVEPINKTVQVVSLDFLRQIADQRGKAIYGQFSTTRPAPNRILISLETKVVSPDAGYRTANLSSIRMEFQKNGGKWVTLDSPTALSA